jgi:hypothetical protein
MRAFIQQWFGLSLTGDVSDQLLLYFYGKGGNGKSVLIDAVSHVAGDYGETVPIETFLDHGKSRGAGQATPDLAHSARRADAAHLGSGTEFETGGGHGQAGHRRRADPGAASSTAISSNSIRSSS